MQVNQIEIDDGLIENAIKASGLNNKKELIEKALLFFAQQIKQQNATQSIIDDFYNLPDSELETINTPSVYQGKSLSLEDMETAIEYEASLHK
ncbi:hypothetical protein DOJK_01889 [Patescibacteria group bacterium]|nr:hypothetical protein DOJK_01889 [Patescibacteria group bacterium]